MQRFKIEDISTYRSELMGFAILWIMSFHFEFIQIFPVHFLTQFGYAGVEIFMVVSGLGLYYSLEKDNNVIHFYKRRFFRIIPIYYLLGIADSIIVYKDNLITYLFRYSTIGYWIDSYYGDWYIPSLMMLYFFAPIIKKIVDKEDKVFLTIFIVIILSIVLLLGIYYNYIDRPHYFFIYRIPAFVFGMQCALWIKKRKGLKPFTILAVIGILFFVFLYSQCNIIYYYRFSSFLFLSPIILLFLTILFKHNPCKINLPMAAIGKASLEIYLIQGFIYHLYIYNIISISKSLHDIIAVLFIIISSIGGIFVHKLYSRIESIFLTHRP